VYAEGYETPLVNDDRELDDPTAELTFSAGEDTTTVLVEVATLGDLSAGDYTLSVEEAELTRDEPQALDGRSAEDVCDEAEALEDPARAQYFEAEEVLEDDVDYQAVLCTEQGAVLIDLFEEEAPITVNSFVFLAINHYFDDTTFHRVVPDFVVQGGDPTGTGAGGPGYEFVNETDNDLSFGDEGVVGMANAGPDTNGSQFFITLAPVDQLDGDYTIFGEVLEGQDVVQDIEERDPSIAEEPGDALYTIVIVTE
jgi:cyclophilin family peptidyl-prolyl cis-trans isomerase